MRNVPHLFIVSSACAMIAVLASGCGLQGPLYLPQDKPAAPVIVPPTPAPETNNADTSDDDDASNKAKSTSSPVKAP